MSRYREIDFSYKKFILIPLGIGITLLLIIGGVFLFMKGGSKTSRYNNAVNSFTAGNYEEAAQQFEKLGDYRDSKKRASESLTLMHYTNGKSAFANGEYEKAKEEYLLAGDHEDAKLLAEECGRASHFAKGEALFASGDLDKAAAEFKKSEYKDYKDKIAEIYIVKSDKVIADGEFDKALELALDAADYKGSEEPVLSCYYKMGEAALAKNDLKNAGSYFLNAEEYKDAPDRAKAVYYQLGTDALSKKDYDNAAQFLQLAMDHKDAQAIAKEAFYIAGTRRYQEKKYEAACQFFKLAGSYKDSEALYKASCYTNGILTLKAGRFDEAIGMFENCGNYKFAKDMVNVCLAEAEMAAGKISNALATYKKVSSKVKVSGFDVQGRKSFASRWYTMDKICSSYNVSTNNITVQKRFSTYIRRWWVTGFLPGQGVSLRYSVNNDGTFNVTGTVGWGRFTNFSSVQSNLRSEVHVSTIGLAHIKKFPTAIKLSRGAKLKYSGGKFVVTYSKKSGKVKYSSTIVYR